MSENSPPEAHGISSLQKRSQELPPQATVHASLWAQVAALAERESRDGRKVFLRWELRDATSELSFTMWDDHAQWGEAKSLIGQTPFVKITGDWSTGNYGLEPRNWLFAPMSPEEEAEILEGDPELRARQAADYAQIEAFVAAFTEPRLKALSELFLERFGSKFRRTGAARTYHHARRGGLVEHVAQMMRTAAAVAVVYPELHADLVLAGVLFHDCGKLWENRYSRSGFEMPYREAGELIGHIPMGMELVNALWRELTAGEQAEAWAKLEPSNEKVRLHLLHLIASHHGELAFGSPVQPKTPEAQLLHYVDNIDAKMEMFRGGYERVAEIAPGVHDIVRPIGRIVKPLGRPGLKDASDEIEDEPNV